MKKLVMFDVDGTLTDTNVVDSQCFVKAIRQATGFEGVSGDWSDYTHVSDSGVVREVYERHAGRYATAKEIEDVKEAFIRTLVDELKANPERCKEMAGANEAIKALREEPNVVLAVATGGWGETAKMKLKHAGIDISGIPFSNADHFIARVNIMRRSEIEALRAIEERNISERVYVGDGLWDVKASQTLGYRLIGIGQGEKADVLTQQGVESVLPDYTALNHFKKIIGLG